ncbi:hypothetical protein D3C72_1706480 [compost metagenome]
MKLLRSISSMVAFDASGVARQIAIVPTISTAMKMPSARRGLDFKRIAVRWKRSGQCAAVPANSPAFSLAAPVKGWGKAEGSQCRHRISAVTQLRPILHVHSTIAA